MISSFGYLSLFFMGGCVGGGGSTTGAFVSAAWAVAPRSFVSTKTTTTTGAAASSSRTASSTSLFVATDSVASSSSSSSPTKTPLFVDGTLTKRDDTTTHGEVQEYYGKELQTSADLKTNACCTANPYPKHIQECIRRLHPDTVKRYYGCGLCVPQYDLEGASILDLGCGAGRDVYIASQLVGEAGRVVGIDMTDEQLDAARQVQEYHAEAFEHSRSNVEFHHGYLETLHDMMISDGGNDEKEKGVLERNSFDVIMSNCVINLCTDKAAVLRACYELLKPGGEMYFSDVYSNRRVPEVLRQDKVLWGECLSGALYWNDFINIAKDAGFRDPRLVEDKPVTVENREVSDLLQRTGNGNLRFYSATYRLCKNERLDADCEDYGQAVRYAGTIPRYETGWMLDKHHLFEAGTMHKVCGNTWHMLRDNPSLSPHFEFHGNFDKHYGIFEGCGKAIPYDDASATSSSSSSSCC